MNLDRSTVSRTVSRLVSLGLILALEGDDRRSKVLKLTDKGRAELGRLHCSADGQVSEALSLLDEANQASVVLGLQIYARALAKARRQREYTIRPIEPRDDAAIARIIRTVLESFEMTGEGSAIRDREVDSMNSAYSSPGSRYLVVERDGRTVGGAGFGCLNQGDGTIAELRKMYLLPEARGCGMGRRLLSAVLNEARLAGYKTMYLETIHKMAAARGLYESFGFKPRESPLGCTGHTDCEIWYTLDL